MGSDVRNTVKEHYGNIAKEVGKKSNRGCCGSGKKTKSCGCGTQESTASLFGSSNYMKDEVKDLPQNAIEASLGCANPLLFAGLKKGETVLDLGSGGGIDVLIASKHVGETGRIYGLDMTDEMLALANKNKMEMGVKNVDFIKGYIEDIPLKDGIIDVIMSNCVINLSGDKEKVVAEAYRVLKPGGRLAIADIVRLKDVPTEILKIAKLWSSCIAGALKLDDYKTVLKDSGFKDIEVEPVNIYTRDIIEELIQEAVNSGELKNLPDLDEAFWNIVDGAFAGAHVKAIK